MVSTPKAPDPVATAAAQSGTNRDTAIASGLLSMTNQVGPDGTLTYNQTGTNSYVDSLTHKTVTLPSYTATTSLSAGQQAIKDQTDAASLNLGKLANQQSAAIGAQLSKPFSFSNNDASQFAYDLASPRILQQQKTDEATLRSQLVASGIRPGTAQWDSEMSRQTNANSDQLNQLTLQGQSQAYNQALSTYNEPLNSISALMSGSQVASPTTGFTSTPQSQVAGVDYTGLVSNNYNQQVNAANATNGVLGGLFGTALTAGIKYCDRRLKSNIMQIGEKAGLPWYSFRYKWDTPSQPLREGFMAQEVIGAMPEAVTVAKDGFYRVNEAMILEAA